VTYIVRDCYFEPSLGHSHADALQELRAKTLAGRPTLFEMHRLNFIGEERTMLHALD